MEHENKSSTQDKDPAKDDKPVTVTVNNKQVNFNDHKVSGLVIKTTAIGQGVQIQPDFNLFEVTGNHLKPIADDDKVTLHPNQVFRAVAPDDNSTQ